MVFLALLSRQVAMLQFTLRQAVGTLSRMEYQEETGTIEADTTALSRLRDTMTRCLTSMGSSLADYAEALASLAGTLASALEPSRRSGKKSVRRSGKQIR